MRRVVAILLLVVAVVVATDPLSKERSLRRAPVSLEQPQLVIADQAVRIDLTAANTMYHLHVVKVVACSAVDIPWRQFDIDEPSATGCNSPGFIGHVIYTDGGMKDDKFQVRQRGRSMYIRKRLIDKRSPTVYLEVHVKVDDEAGDAIMPVVQQRSVDQPWILTTRYSAPERAVSLDGVPLVEIDGNGIHIPLSSPWMGYSIMALLGLVVALLVVLMVRVKLRKRKHKRTRNIDTEHKNVIAKFVYSALDKGFFSGDYIPRSPV